MAKILLIGRGPLPGPDVKQLGFSQLRTLAFLDALRSADHDIRLVLLVTEGDGQLPSEWSGTVTVTEDGPGWISQIEAATDGADAVVSAGPYNPGRAGAAVAGDLPFWADIPGDPLAELAALARAQDDELSPAQMAAAHAGAAAVLSRADAISVISEPQRFATLGQLSWIGRTLTAAADPPVYTVPITARFGFPEMPARTLSEGPLVLALSGAFNPWVDVDGLIQTLELLFRDRSDVKVVCTGGGIPGFYEAGYARFEQWAQQHPDQVTLHGWVSHDTMVQVLSTAHAGISMDGAGPEPELGSRTRLLLFAHLGLMPVSTVRCELAQSWSQGGALVPLPFNDPSGSAAVLKSLRVQTDIIHQAQRYCRATGELPTVFEPLLNWCASPTKTAAWTEPQAVMAAELESQRDELSRVYSSPTWIALNRLHGIGQTLGRIKARQE